MRLDIMPDDLRPPASAACRLPRSHAAFIAPTIMSWTRCPDLMQLSRRDWSAASAASEWRMRRGAMQRGSGTADASPHPLQGRERMGAPRLELRGIRKAYPAVVANDGIDLAVAPGEIHAVIGENGAGKSTLMKIIYGMVRPDAGDMLWEGARGPDRDRRPMRSGSASAWCSSISPCSTRSPSRRTSRWRSPARGGIEQLSEKIAAVSQRYGLPLEPDRPVYTMSVGERQRVEIVRALMQDARPADHGRADLGAHAAGGREAVRDLAPDSPPRAAASSTSATSWKRSSSVCDARDGAARRARSPASCIRSAPAPPRWRA